MASSGLPGKNTDDTEVVPPLGWVWSVLERLQTGFDFLAPSLEEWRTRDPIPSLASGLREAGQIADADLSRVEEEVAAEIAQAVAFAEAAAWEPVEELTRFVHSEASPLSPPLQPSPERPEAAPEAAPLQPA